MFIPAMLVQPSLTFKGNARSLLMGVEKLGVAIVNTSIRHGIK